MSGKTAFFTDKPTITTSKEKLKRFTNARLAEGIWNTTDFVHVEFEDGKIEKFPLHTVEKISNYPESDSEGSDNQ